MIARCRRCKRRIRDCTEFAPALVDGLVLSVPVRGWYHTDDGQRSCGGHPARPEPLLAVRCRWHPRAVPSCRSCLAAAEISLDLHNDGRCIPRLCGWPHTD